MPSRSAKTATGLLAAVCALALLGAQPAFGALPEPVGFNTALNGALRGEVINDPTFPPDVVAEFNEVEALGGDVVRIGVPWAVIEGPGDVPPGTDQGYFGLERLDALTDLAAEKDIKVLMTVIQTPTWASSCPKLFGQCILGGIYHPWQYPPQNYADWEEFIAFLSERYQDVLAGIEVWNEANWGGAMIITANFSNVAARAAHAQLIKRAFEARAPGVPIYAGALHPGPEPGEGNFERRWNDWMTGLYPTIKDKYTYWSVHDYDPASTAYPPPSFTNSQRQRLQELGDPDVPVSVDEFGEAAPPNTLEGQATQIPLEFQALGALADAQTNPVFEAIQFLLRDYTGYDDFAAHGGLLTGDLTRKPSYYTVKDCLSGVIC